MRSTRPCPSNCLATPFAFGTPTLVIFGADGRYVPASAFDGTFREVDNVSSVVALPGAGHFIHHQAAAFVTQQIEAWVAQPPSTFRHLACGRRSSTYAVRWAMIASA